MAKDWWFKFDVGAWLSDQDLRRCSPAARGVWIDMLCLMAKCEETGFLITDGVPWPREDVAAAIGGDSEFVLPCIDELLAKGVSSRDARGAYGSRRMIRDSALRQQRASSGRSGGFAKASKGLAKGWQKSTNTPSKPLTLTLTLNSSPKKEKDTKKEKKETPPIAPPKTVRAEKPSGGAGASGGSNRTPKTKESTGAPRKAPQTRPRNKLWDAVVAEWFADGIPDSQRANVGKFVKEFRQLKATPAEIGIRRRRIRKCWGPGKDTPASIVKHWSVFKDDQRPENYRPGRTAAAARRGECPEPRKRPLPKL